MPMPVSQDYNEAIQSPGQCFSDPELRQCEARCNAIGIPMPRSGNFADVYEMTHPGGKKWAVKCFTRQVKGLRERYAAISAYLQQVNLPFMVDFTYLEQGIRVKGEWYPALKMQWVEGYGLNEFVKEHADQPQHLELLCQIWVRLARRMREAGMAHCDLQHGNVLLVPGAKANSLAVRLIDYDGLFVPALADQASGEVGHPAYQHPQRLRDGTYNAEVDRFSHLVIYTALRALIVGSRYLWNKYDNGDNLLFRQFDLAVPGESQLFEALRKLNDPEVRRFAQILAHAAQGPLEQAPLLDDLVADKARTTTQRKSETAAGNETSPEALFAEATAGASGAPVPRQRTMAKSTRPWKSLIAALVVVAAIAAGLFVVGSRKNSDTRREVSVAQNREDESKKKPEAVAVPASPRTTPQPEATPAPKPELKSDPKPEPKSEPKPEPKPELNPEPKPEPLPPLKAPEKTGELLCLKGHTDAVRAVAISLDGRRALSGGLDQTVRVYDLQDGKEIQRLTGHDEPVCCVAISPDGQLGLSAGGGRENGDNAIRLWDLKTGKELRRLTGHRHTVMGTAFLPDGRRAVSASLDHTVRLWDLSSGAEIRRFDGMQKAENSRVELQVWSLALSLNGYHAVCGLRNGTVHRFDVESGRGADTFTVPGSSFSSVAFSPDGRCIAAASAGREGSNRAMYLWDVSTGKELQRWEEKPGTVNSMVFGPDGRHVFLGLNDHDLVIWNIYSGKEELRLKGHTNPITTVARSPDGRYALTGSDDGTVRLWGLPDLTVARLPEPVPDPKLEPKRDLEWPPIALAALRRQDISAYELTVAGAGNPKLAPRELVAVLGDSRLSHWSPVLAVAVGADRVAAADSMGSAIAWDLKTGKALHTLPSQPRAARAVDFRPDGRMLAVGCEDGRVLLADLPAGKPVTLLERYFCYALRTRFSPDGKWLAVGFADGMIKLFDLKLRRESTERKAHEKGITCLEFSRDGRLLASAADDGTVILSNPTTLAERVRLKGHDKKVSCLAFSPDARELASGDDAGTIKTWEIPAGTERASVPRDGGRVVALAFRKDGVLLAANAASRDVLIWQPSTGQKLHQVSDGSSGLTSGTFSLDGERLALGFNEHFLRIVDTTTGEHLSPCGEGRGRVSTVALHGSTRVLVGGTSRSRLDAWHGPSLTTERPLQLGNWLHNLALSPNGQSVLTAGDRAGLFDVRTGHEIFPFAGHRGWVVWVAADSQGRWLASSSHDGTVKIWEAATGKVVHTLIAGKGWIEKVAFSADGKLIAANGDDGIVRVWDTEKGQEKFTLKGHTWSISGLAFSPDGRLLVSSSNDNSIRFWDTQRGKELRALNRPEKRYDLRSVVFSPNGRILAFVEDGAIHFWDCKLNVEKPSIRLAPPAAVISQIAYSPDGKHLLTANGNGTVYILRLPPP